MAQDKDLERGAAPETSKRGFSDSDVGFGASGVGAVAPATKTYSDADVGIEPPARGFGGWARDIAATAVKGAISVPEMAVGLVDIPTGGRVGKALENQGGSFGFRPKEAKAIVNDWHSDATKDAQHKFQEADGILEKAKVAITHPSLVATAVGESLPSMAAGGVVARGLLGASKAGYLGNAAAKAAETTKGAIAAGAIGEGATMAGAQASAIRQETEDGLLTPGQAGAAVATGAVGGLLGYGGGKLAERLGIGNVDTMLAQGTQGIAKDIADEATTAAANPLMAQAAKSLPRQVIEGALVEGVFEELPQSMTETIIQNLALDRPWADGLDDAVVMGILTGGAMGAGAAGYRGLMQPKSPKGGEVNPAKEAADQATQAAQESKAAASEKLRAAWAEQAQLLAQQEVGEPQVLQTDPPDGAAKLAEQQAQQALVRQAGIEAGRAEFNPDDEINQSIGAGVRPSVAMGLDPNAGGLTGAAALAVDSGVSQPLQAQQSAEQPAEQSLAAAAAQADEATGEIGAVERAGQIQERLSFLTQMGRAQGWDARMVQDRDALEGELSALMPQLMAGEPKSAEPTQQDMLDAVDTGGRIAQLEAQAAADEARAHDWATRQYKPNKMPLPAHAAKGGPADVSEAHEQRRLKAIADASSRAAQARAQADALRQQGNTQAIAATKQPTTQADVAQTTGADFDVSQASQAQQAQSQQQAPRTAAVQAVDSVSAGSAAQTADQGVVNGGSTTVDNGSQASIPNAAQGIAKAQAIAKEGNERRAAEQKRKLEASERWTRMTPEQRSAVLVNAKGLNVVQRKNLHKKAWADMTDKVRAALLDAVAPVNATEKEAKKEDSAKKSGANNAQIDSVKAGAAINNKQASSSIASSAASAPQSASAITTRKYGDYELRFDKATGDVSATLNGVAVGDMMFERLKDGRYNVADMGVDAKHRRKGLARAMLDMANENHEGQVTFANSALTEDGAKFAAATSLSSTMPAEVLEWAKKLEQSTIQEAAAQAATSPTNDTPEPTEAQKEAGNYKKGHLRLHGLEIAIENPAGTQRNPAWPALKNHYGYFKGSVGADKDHVDVFLTDKAEDASLPVFVVDQKHRNGKFDEHKVIMGAANEAEARQTYLQNYEDGWTGLSAITEMTLDDFKAWVMDAEKTKKPAQEVLSAYLPAQEPQDSFPIKEAVQSYSGISHSGAARANGDKEAFDKFMATAAAAGEGLAETDAQREALSEAAKQLRADYLTQYQKLMNVRAGTYSWYVAGRGNLNSKQANSRNSALDKAMQQFDGWVGDNVDRIKKAVLDARTPEQVQADRAKLAAKIEEKLAKKNSDLKAQLLKFLSFKSGEEMPYGKSIIITRVSYGKDGYPSSLTFKMADGSPVTDDKLELVEALKDKGETIAQAKERIRALVDEVRAENPELTNGVVGRIRATASSKAAQNKEKVEKVSADYLNGAMKGDTITASADFDYVTGGKPMVIEDISPKGEVHVVDPVRGGRTSFSASLAAARRITFEVKKAEPEQEPQSYLDRHNAIEDGISAGTLELPDYKAAFADLEANQAQVIAELQKLTKDKLLKAGGAAFAYRMHDEKKDAIVQAAYTKMLDTYALGRSYGPNSYFLSAEGIAKNKADKAQALRDMVANTTAEDLAARAAEIKAARDEFKAKREAAAQALANPQTLQDFRGFMRHWVENGDTTEAAYLRLTPEKRRQFDALEAESTRDRRDAAKRAAKTAVATAGNTSATEVIATKHTKHGHDLFVVKLADRVERDAYETLNNSAKRLGGSYSSYRGNGAIPGFQFRTREAAEAFRQLVAGDTQQAEQLANQRRDAFEDDKSQTAVERLRTMADALDDFATQELSVERKSNTARRARFAAAAEEHANGNKAFAATMRSLADAIESGDAVFLDGVRTKTQLAQLNSHLAQAKVNQLYAKHGSWSKVEEAKHTPMDEDTADFAEWPQYTMFRSDLASLARQLQEVDGGKKMGAALAKVADDVTQAYTDWAKANLLRVSQFGRGDAFADFSSRDDAERAIKRSGLVGKAIVLAVKRGQNRIVLSPGEAMQRGLWVGDGDKKIHLTHEFVSELISLGKRKGNKSLSIPWQLEGTLEKRNRLQRMGIQTAPEFRSALRELQKLRVEKAQPDRIKELERAMIGRRNDGLDFFPTSPAVVSQMLEAAEIQEGMAVLEPSAGMGHIADAIAAEAGVWPDVVELSGDRRELLLAKGHQLADFNDFMDMQPRAFFTYGDTFRAPDGKEGIMRGQGGMGSQRVRLEDKDGNGLGFYDRSDLVGVAQNGTLSGYDRIVMNPPFSDGRDIQHVQHAYTLLKPGGRIVAIMGEGAFFQSNKKAQAFREWLQERGATNEKLPDGSFMDPSLPVNTSVAARMVVIDKPLSDRASTDDAHAGKRNGAATTGTPADRAVMDMVREGKSATEVLKLIAATSRKPFNRKVASLLLKTGINPKLSMGGAMGGADGFTFLAKYSRANNEVTLTDGAQAQAEQIMLHELVHAATLAALDKGSLAGLQMRKLYEHVKRTAPLALRRQYGMKNVGEFVAEVFTNPEFQGALKNMPAPAGNSLKSAWESLVRILKSILGLQNDDTSALAQALELGVQVMRDNMKLRKQADKGGQSQVSEIDSPDMQKARVLQGEPVARLATSIAPSGAPAIRAWASQLFAEQGGVAHNPEIGDVVINERSIRSSIAHGRPNAYKVAAFAAVKDVLEKGVLVLSARHGRDGDSFYVSAPVKLDDADNIVTVLVKRDPNDQRMYLHSVATKESLLSRRVSRTDTMTGVERSGSNDSGDATTLATRGDIGKASSSEVADELNRLLGMGIDTSNPASSMGGDADAFFGAADLREFKSSAVDYAHQVMSHPGKVSLWDKTVGTMRHLAERKPAFKPVFEAAQQFIDDVASVANQAAQHAPRLIPRVETMRDMLKKPIGVADNKAIGKALFGGTLDWGRDQHGKAMPLDALKAKYANYSVELKAEVLLASNKITPQLMAMWRGKKLEQFEAIIKDKFESTILKAGVAFNHKELKEFFGLNDQQISLYDEARATVDKSLDIAARAEMLRTLGRDYDFLRDMVMDAPTLTEAWKLLDAELEERAKLIPESRDQMAAKMHQIASTVEKARDLMDHGYMPLQRFGKYTVHVKGTDGDSLYYGMFESKADSHKMFQVMKREYPDAEVTQGTINEHKHKLMAGITPETAELFGSMLGLDAEGNQEKDKAFQEYLKLAKNNHSAMKRLIHRKGIVGYSEDVGRVLASFVYSNARVAATGLNAGKMETAINDLNTKHKHEGELGEIAAKLRSYIQDPQEEGQAIRGMLFAQYLGGSLASAAVNMTQPFAVTLPWLSQYGGMVKASRLMTSALKDMAKRGFKYESDLAHALKMAEDDGVVSPQEIHQLMAQARGAGGLRTGDGTKLGNARAEASNYWEKVKVGWGQPFALAEQFNRRSTFITAYRLAKDQGMSDPADFARRAVVETQFLYTKANKPQWARGAVGGTLFTFKTYSVSFLELMQRTWNAGEAGSPERAAGRRAVGWAMLMLMLMGGAGGLPFVEDAEDLIDGIGQMMGYNVSAKQWRKELMQDALGQEVAGFLEQGLSGLPGAPIDVSGRLGMGNLIPGTGLFLNKQSNTRDVVEMMGPAGDLVARGFSGAKSILSGVINAEASSVARGAMEMMPTAVRNAAKGSDMAISGMYKDSKGYKVMDTTLDEAIFKMIGFQPASVANAQEGAGFQMRSRSFYTQTSNEIRAQWAKALFEKDDAAIQNARARLEGWNSRNPEMPISINMRDIWKRVHSMEKDRAQRMADTAPKALRRDMQDWAREQQR